MLWFSSPCSNKKVSNNYKKVRLWSKSSEDRRQESTEYLQDLVGHKDTAWMDLNLQVHVFIAFIPEMPFWIFHTWDINIFRVFFLYNCAGLSFWHVCKDSSTPATVSILTSSQTGFSGYQWRSFCLFRIFNSQTIAWEEQKLICNFFFPPPKADEFGGATMNGDLFQVRVVHLLYLQKTHFEYLIFNDLTWSARWGWTVARSVSS